jgi:all-trans-retinol 13,14-reductase
MNDPEHAELPLLYASFPAAKDPDFQNRYPGRSTIELITLADHTPYARWEQQAWQKRGADYEAAKERMTERMLDRFFEVMPTLKGRIDHCELSTPLSTRHFTNYAHGEIYGLSHTPERFRNRELSVHTPIRGLYLTGQDLVSCGIGGALSSAMLTATVLLKRNLFKELAGRGR